MRQIKYFANGYLFLCLIVCDLSSSVVDAGGFTPISSFIKDVEKKPSEFVEFISPA